jgi:ankyrin repeat protein
MANNEQEFFTAVREGDTATVQTMLNVNNTLANIQNMQGSFPLFMAAENGHHLIVELLINAGADINRNSENEWSALSGAASYGHINVLRLLIEEGANVNIEEVGGRTPLLIAAHNGHTEAVRVLIENGADVNTANNGGDSPLTASARRGHIQIVELLINAGVNVNPEGNTRSPLINAVDSNNVQIVGLLLENGADVYKRITSFVSPRLTALSLAIVTERVQPSAEISRIVKLIRNTILSEAVHNTILIAQQRHIDINQDEAFIIFSMIAEEELRRAGDESFNAATSRQYLRRFYERAMGTRNRVAAEMVMDVDGGSRSRTKSGKRNRSQRRPPNAVCTRAQKLGIRLTVKRNNKRVYKSEEVLRTQIKNALNRQKRKQK